MSRLEPKETTDKKNRASSMDAHDASYIPCVGDQVLVGPTMLLGTVAFFGKTNFSDAGNWIGVVLTEPVGKNDGSVKGIKYFDCLPNYGLFVRVHQVVKATAEAAQMPKQDSSASSQAPLVPRQNLSVSSHAPQVSKQDSSASSPRQSPRPSAHARRAMEVEHKLANAVEEVDELLIRELLPQAYSLGVPHGAIESAQRTLNFRLHEALVKDIDKVRDAVGGLVECAKELETEFANVAFLSMKLPMDAPQATSTADVHSEDISVANSFVAQLKAQVENQVITGLERQIVTAVQQAVSMATHELVAAAAEMQQARAFPEGSAKLKARQGLLAAHGNGELGTILQEVYQGAPESINLKAQRSLAAAYSPGELNTILQDINSDAPRDIRPNARPLLLSSGASGGSSASGASGAPVASGPSGASGAPVASGPSGAFARGGGRGPLPPLQTQSLLLPSGAFVSSVAAAYSSGELNTIFQDINSNAPRDIRLKARRSLAAAYNSGELDTVLQEVNAGPLQTIKLKAMQSLVESYNTGELGSILQDVTQSEPESIKLKARRSSVQAYCRAQAKHCDWLAIFQEFAAIGPGSAADPVLGESEFRNALSKVHPQLSPAQLSVLWQGRASLADRDKFDLETFIEMAEAVEKGDEAAAEWADMAAETFTMLGVSQDARLSIATVDEERKEAEEEEPILE